MKKIDLEAHCYSPELIKRFSSRQGFPHYNPENYAISLSKDFTITSEYKMKHLYESCEERVAIMDAAGITMQVLSCSPGIELMDNADDAIEACREVNDWMYSFTQKYPDRFRAFAALPIQNPAAACAEFERCVKKLGFLGWLTFSSYSSSYPDDDLYAPIFDKAGELGVAVYLHPTQPFEGRLTGLGAQLASATFGFGIDTSITLMRLILKGTFDRNPGLKIIIGHLGEGFPFVIKRIMERSRDIESAPGFTRAPAINKELVGYYFENNIFSTTSGQYSLPAFRCTMDEFGIDHILLGSDYPYETPEEVSEFLRSLVLSENDREKLSFRNAETLLGIV